MSSTALNNPKRIFLRAVIYGLVLAAILIAVRIYRTRMDVWLASYLRWSISPPQKLHQPLHIMFLVTDHFEPANRSSLVDRWVAEYPKFADRHRDSSGRALQHTWFYPAEQPQNAYMARLRGLVSSGYGEVEFHLHHGSDTWDSALLKYRAGISYLQSFGFLKTVDGQTRFAFVHGNNSLDDSLGSRVCGVKRELTMLRELGCFADFTFPNAWDNSQPSVVNQIYEATDDDRAKSYSSGAPLTLGQPVAGDLLMFTGPLVIRPTIDPTKLFLSIDNADIHRSFPASEKRVDSWVKANIHVAGRPDWIFIKVSTHAAASSLSTDEILGPNFDRALSYLESHYNDGTHYVLHYVTAREAYNLARASAAGMQGPPEDYVDWLVKPYLADRRAAGAIGAWARAQRLLRLGQRTTPSL